MLDAWYASFHRLVSPDPLLYDSKPSANMTAASEEIPASRGYLAAMPLFPCGSCTTLAAPIAIIPSKKDTKDMSATLVRNATLTSSRCAARRNDLASTRDGVDALYNAQ
jgi:hypothetical protein